MAPGELEQHGLFPRTADELQAMLAEISGFAAVSVQPAAGAHGELAGMLVVRAWHEAQGNNRRKVLIPDTAHGTNPASAQMAGMQVVVVKCDAMGSVDLDDLRAKCEQHRSALAAMLLISGMALRSTLQGAGPFASAASAVQRSRSPGSSWRSRS